MAIDPNQELARFHDFLGDCLSQGDALTPEDALALWRIENPAFWEIEETVLAVQESLADMEAGDTGMPLDEFVEQFRQRHGLAEQ